MDPQPSNDNSIRNKALYICIGLLAACAITYTTALIISPLPIIFIDRDKSGLISIRETFNAINIGKRPFKEQSGCIEYYWVKDGLTAYRSCWDPNK